MKKLLSILLLLVTVQGAFSQERDIQTTAFTRDWLHAGSASLARAKLGIVVTNLTATNLSQMYGYPTNISTGVGTLSATVGGVMWTLSGSTTAGWQNGYNINDNTHNHQYRINKIVDATHFYTFTSAQNSSTTDWLLYPNLATWTDINANVHGTVENDDSLSIDVNHATTGNSGEMYFNSSTNTAAITIGVDSFGKQRLTFQMAAGNFAGNLASAMEPFSLSVYSDIDSLRVLPNSDVSIKHGVTNDNGNLAVNTALFHTISTFTNSANTISGTNLTYTLSTLSSSFSGITPGYVVLLNGIDRYTVSKVVSATQIHTVEPLSTTYSAVSLAFLPPHEFYNTTTPSFASFVASDGSLALGQEAYGNGVTSLYLLDDTNSFRFKILNQAEGRRFELGTQATFYAGSFAINTAAPGDSLAIKADGTCSVKVGITNVSGNVACDTSLAFPNVGTGLVIKGGSNAKIGIATLSGGTVTVSTTAVTANSVVFLTEQPGGANWGACRVSTITAGTSFVITSNVGTDTGLVGWFIVEKN